MNLASIATMTLFSSMFGGLVLQTLNAYNASSASFPSPPEQQRIRWVRWTTFVLFVAFIVLLYVEPKVTESPLAMLFFGIVAFMVSLAIYDFMFTWKHVQYSAIPYYPVWCRTCGSADHMAIHCVFPVAPSNEQIVNWKPHLNTLPREPLASNPKAFEARLRALRQFTSGSSEVAPRNTSFDDVGHMTFVELIRFVRATKTKLPRNEKGIEDIRKFMQQKIDTEANVTRRNMLGGVVTRDFPFRCSASERKISDAHMNSLIQEWARVKATNEKEFEIFFLKWHQEPCPDSACEGKVELDVN